MKARKVKLDPGMSFGKALERTLAVRMDELCSFAGDPGALHDMRIAAKRVRYVLEVGEPVLPDATAGIKAAKKLQDLLGEVHDCDELLPLIDRHIERLREEDAVAALAGESLPNRRKYRGLEALRAHTIARRAQCLGRFEKQWPKAARTLHAGERVKT